MESADAILLALALHSAPARSADARAARLPDGVTEVLKIALGQKGAIAQAASLTGDSPELLVDAARFYVEQQLLSRECEADPWRVLGVAPHAPRELVVAHRRLLLSLVHPDRSDDWAEGYADRLQRAWKVLKDAGAEGNDAAQQADALTSQPSWPLADAPNPYVEPIVWPAAERHPPARADGMTDAGNQSNNGALNKGALVASVVAATARAAPRRSIKMRWAASLACILGSAALAITLVMLLPADEGEHVRVTDSSGLPDSSPTADPAKPATTVSSIEQQAAVVLTDAIPEVLSIAESPSAEQATLPPVSGVEITSTAQPARLDSRPDTPRGMKAVGEVSRREALRQADSSVSASILVTEAPRARSRAPEALDFTAASVLPPRADARSSRNIVSVLPQAQDSHTNPATDVDPAIGLRVMQLSDQDAQKIEASAFALPTSDVRAGAPSSLEASEALGHFSRIYATGNLEALLGLFSVNDRGDGGASLAAEYGDLFSTTSDRTLAIKGVGWKAAGDRLIGQGWYEARYRRLGKVSKRIVSGRINFELVREGDMVRFSRVSPEAGGV